MNRRTLLAGTSSTLSARVVGCIDQFDVRRGNGDDVGSTGSRNDDVVPPTTGVPVSLAPDCGPADQPLSALLTEETGDPDICFEGATPSLAVENEREVDSTVTVELEGERFAETYALESGDRVVETNAFEARSNLTGTVDADGNETRITWPDRSCYRHGIALTSDGVEIGWIEPLSGPGETQHNCYAGDGADLTVVSRGKARSVTVTIVARCSAGERTETFELNEDEVDRRGLLTNGGVYDLEAVVDGGESESHAFNEGCWGVEIDVDEDGDVRIHHTDVD